MYLPVIVPVSVYRAYSSRSSHSYMKLFTIFYVLNVLGIRILTKQILIKMHTVFPHSTSIFAHRTFSRSRSVLRQTSAGAGAQK